MNDNKNKAEDKIPESSSTKPMDSKKDVENANDEKINQDFPGYPHYPAKEDIMDQRTDSHRVDLDVENIPNSKNTTGLNQRFSTEDDKKKAKEAMTPQPGLGEDDYSDIGPRTEITRDGLETLGGTNAEIGIPQNRDNEDLNKRAPGTDLDEEDELGETETNESDVTPEERAALENVFLPTQDEENLRRAALDHTDLDGDELNEESFGEVVTGSDLDVPEEVDETESDALGQGDEENKYYSLGGDQHENLDEDPAGGL